MAYYLILLSLLGTCFLELLSYLNEPSTPAITSSQNKYEYKVTTPLKLLATYRQDQQKNKAKYLVSAIERDDYFSVKTLFKSGASVLDQDAEFGVVPLFLAVRKGKIAAVNALIDAGASLDIRVPGGITVLHMAAGGDSPEMVQLLLKAGASRLIDEADEGGATPLLFAISLGKVGAVEVLLAAGASLDGRLPEGVTILHMAVEGESVEIVQLLLKAGASCLIDKADEEGATPLVCAISQGKVGAAEALLGAGASLDIRGPGGITVLHMAAGGDSTEMVKLLLKSGASRLIDEADEGGATPLVCAIRQGKVGAAEALLGAGASIDVRGPGGITVLHMAVFGDSTEMVQLLLKAGASHLIDKTDEGGATPLLVAIGQGKVATAEALLGAGASLDIRGPGGITVLHLAAGGDSAEMVQLLLKAGASRLIDAPNEDGATPLQLAIMQDKIATAGALLDAGASTDVRGPGGSTVLHLAVAGESAEMVQLLLKSGATRLIDEADEGGATPLVCAIWQGKVGAAEALLAAGASLDIRGPEGETILHRAVASETLEMVQLLLKFGATRLIDEANKDGETPLQFALRRRQEATAEALLAAGASIDIRGPRKETVLYLAAKHNSPEMVQLLLKSGATRLMDEADKDDFTPLYIAVALSRLDVVEVLLDAGASIDVRGGQESTVLQMIGLHNSAEMVKLLCKYGASRLINEADMQGYTPLITAINRSNKDAQEYLDLVEALLDAGASLEKRGPGGNTVWHTVVNNKSIGLVEVLAKANGAKLIDAVNNAGETPLYSACKQGMVGVVRALLDAGASLEVRGPGGNTPWYVAVDDDSLELIQLLIKAGGSKAIDMANDEGVTPLLWACCNDRLGIVQALLDAGASLEVKTPGGYTVWHVVSTKASADLVQILLNAKAAKLIDVAADDGTTPLYFACTWGSRDVVQAMLEAGASLILRGPGGNTVLHAAVKNNFIEIVKLLVRAGVDLQCKNDAGLTAIDVATDPAIIEYLKSEMSGR